MYNQTSPFVELLNFSYTRKDFNQFHSILVKCLLDHNITSTDMELISSKENYSSNKIFYSV